ncbi:hypothetical protein BMS3Bbin04_01161 [bacterium BMS3Bbin04]|nr:hypothetical protein BMS3Bbin04_01161 [bacterium BMS3Bbin04]
MKHGSRVLVLLLLTMVFAACSTGLHSIPKPLYIDNVPMSDSLKEYSTFTFRTGDAKGSAIIQGTMERYLQTMLESKGYRRTEDHPDIFISIDWESELQPYFRSMPGMFKPSDDHSPYSYWSSADESFEHYYSHSFKIKLWKLDWEEPVWTYEVKSACEIQDFRLSAPSLLKNFMLYVPTIATSVREGGLVEEDDFLAYVNYNVANRDWALPGLNTYVTFTEHYGRLFDGRSFRDEIASPELIWMYVDLLNNGVHYRVVGDELELAGHYDVDGRDYYVTVKAKYDGERFRVTEARPLGPSAFNALRDDIVVYSQALEKDHNVFLNAKQPFGAKVVEWDGVPNPFNPYPLDPNDMSDAEEAGVIFGDQE